MISILVSLAALGQLPVESLLSEGGVVGRVCADTNRDGVCGDGEPGLAGVNVLTETGLTVITDASGRFHVAAMGARSIDGLAGGRVQPGRHRLTIDTRMLTAGSEVRPRAQTVEIPVGGAVWAEFAIAAPVEQGAALRRAERGAPKGRVEQQVLSWWWTAKAENAVELAVDGQTVRLEPDNIFGTWVTLPGDGRDVPVVMHERAGKASMWLQRFDVIRRDGSAMVVPREPKAIGAIEASAGIWLTGQVRLKGIAGSTVVLAEKPHLIPESGELQTQVALKPGATTMVFRWSAPGATEIAGLLALPSGEGVTAVGLVDLEGTLDLRRGAPRLFGRGAGAVRARWLGIDWSADLDLRDSDFATLASGPALGWVQPRQPDTFARAPTSFREAWVGSDDSTTSATNAPEGRFRLEVAKEGFFKVGYGSHRAQMHDAETGRYHRALWAGYAEARTPDEAAWGVRAELFGAPATADVSSGLGGTPRHDVLEATGGSFFYLSSGEVVFGSEKVRVEWRDGLTDLPLREQVLRRGVDYSLDCLTGRLLLHRPPGLFELAQVLPGQSLGGAARPLIVVDYEALSLDSGSALGGGELTLRAGPARLSLGAVRETRGYSLLRSAANVKVGQVTITAEGAYSLGLGTDARFSDDGGLSFNGWTGGAVESSGYSVGVRARGPGYGAGSFFDLAYRRRGAGFSDSEHRDSMPFQQISARAEQPFGRFRVGLLIDDRRGARVDAPFDDATNTATTIVSGWAGWKEKRWSVSLAGRDGSYADASTAVSGAGTSVALAGQFRVSSWLNLLASHRQRLLTRGTGPGAIDDTFASVGADVTPAESTTIAVRGGYGPAIGPQVWGGVSHTSGAETHYGGHRWDVDAPSVGGHRMVAGVSREIAPGEVVFAEDVAQTGDGAVSMGRAVGFSAQGVEGLQVSARYERGVREALVFAGSQPREAAAGSLGWVDQGARAFVKAEYRRQPTAHGELLQWIGTAGAEVEFSEALRGTALVLGTHSATAGLLSARLLQGQLGMHARLAHGSVSLRYLYQRELPPVHRGAFGENTLHVVSLLPTWVLSDRLRIAAGGHLAWVGTDASGGWVVTASLRPTVRVWRGMEVGAEVARRSVATDGGELTSLRGEVGYRFNGQVMMAVGYTALGFQGLGFNDGQADSRDRLYVRAEVGY